MIIAQRNVTNQCPVIQAILEIEVYKGLSLLTVINTNERIGTIMRPRIIINLVEQTNFLIFSFILSHPLVTFVFQSLSVFLRKNKDVKFKC